MVADAVSRNQSPKDNNREFFEIFRPKQAFVMPMAAGQSNFDCNPSQLDKVKALSCYSAEQVLESPTTGPSDARHQAF
jgi:hypothetical protein